jgi:hypothetical protein
MPPRTWAASSCASSNASNTATASMYWRVIAALVSSISVCYLFFSIYTVIVLYSIAYANYENAFKRAF